MRLRHQPTAEDRRMLALAMFAEASGEGQAGMKAVGRVILNRSEKRGKSIKDVVLQPKQFSAFNPGDPNRRRMEKAEERRDPVFMKAVQIADRLLSGDEPDPTGGADHYFNPRLAPNASWPKKFITTAEIGNHRFMREPTKAERLVREATAREPEPPKFDWPKESPVVSRPETRMASANPADLDIRDRVMSRLGDLIYGEGNPVA